VSTSDFARTTDEWEVVVGRQLRALRLGANRSQAEVARAANVSLSTVQSLERGGGSSLATLVAVVRALGRSEWLESLAPPATVSPMARLRETRTHAAATRQRASAKHPANPDQLETTA
jgi:transcriptional regulator with XRE-family HTH domain